MNHNEVPRITRTRATTVEEEILTLTTQPRYHPSYDTPYGRVVHPPPGFEHLGVRRIAGEFVYTHNEPSPCTIIQVNEDGVPTINRMTTAAPNQAPGNTMLNKDEEAAAPQQDAPQAQFKAESEESFSDEEEIQRPPTPEHVRRYRYEFELARSFDIEDDLKYCPRHLLEHHELAILEEREKKAAEAEQRKSRFGNVLNVINAPPGYANSSHARHRSKNSNSPNASPGFPSNASTSSISSPVRHARPTPRSQAWKHRVRGDVLPAAGPFYVNMGAAPGVDLGGGMSGQMYGYGQGGQYGGEQYCQSGGAYYQAPYMGNMQGAAQAGNETKGNNKKAPRQFAVQIISPLYRPPQDGNNQAGTETPRGNQGGGASTLQGQQAGGADAPQGPQTGDASAPQGQAGVANAPQGHQAGGSSALHGQAGVSGAIQASASAFQPPQAVQSHQNFYYGNTQPGFHGGNQQQGGRVFGQGSSFDSSNNGGGDQGSRNFGTVTIQGGFQGGGQPSQYGGMTSSTQYHQGGQGGPMGGNMGIMGNMSNMGTTERRRGINPRGKGRGNAYGNNTTTNVPNESPYTYHGTTGPTGPIHEGGHARRSSTVPSGVPPTLLYGAAPIFRPQPAAINPFFYDPDANKAAARAAQGTQGKVRCLSTHCLQRAPTYVAPGFFCTVCGTKAPSAEGGNEQS